MFTNLGKSLYRAICLTLRFELSPFLRIPRKILQISRNTVYDLTDSSSDSCSSISSQVSLGIGFYFSFDLVSYWPVEFSSKKRLDRSSKLSLPSSPSWADIWVVYWSAMATAGCFYSSSVISTILHSSFSSSDSDSLSASSLVSLIWSKVTAFISFCYCWRTRA